MTSPYGATVLEHFRRPRNRRALERPTAVHEGFNPLCGDRVRIELEVDKQAIRAAAFTANACAVCTAAASLLTERIQGASTAAAASVSDAELLAALATDLPASRLACALLPLRTLRLALAGTTPTA